ncbi:MAG: DUF4402 domain-containing protein, partial [Alphaproteobacteria bacterium]|nr:DUF4402 domain-containing protein [Alphaproteobacteria bacterium]
MKTRFYLLAAAGVLAISVGAIMSGPAQAVTDDLTIDAVIIAAIDLDCDVQALDFGTIAASSAGGNNTVTVTTAGARSIAGPGNGSLIGGLTGDEGLCDVTGALGENAVVTVPASTTVSDGTDDMTVNNFTITTPGGSGASPQTFALTGGADSVAIGGDLVVVQGQAPNTYQGTI